MKIKNNLKIVFDQYNIISSKFNKTLYSSSINSKCECFFCPTLYINLYIYLFSIIPTSF